MDTFFSGLIAGLVIFAVVLLAIRIRRRGRRSRAPAAPSIQSFVTSMKAVGELNVFRIMTKEVISASDHWFGEFGKKYLSWLLSTKQITLIIEFDVDFRYDLTDAAFEVEGMGGADYRLTLPPCRHEVLIRDMRIHSEGKTELLPWLMPDLLGRFFTGGFSVEAKNRLIAETRQEARRFAGDLVRKATAEAQASATRSLKMLATGFGVKTLEVEFLPATEFEPAVDTTAIESPEEVTSPPSGEPRS